MAVLEDEFFVATPNYLFKFDVTTWGWIHLLLGVVVVLAGFALFAGRVWASAIFVIWALTVHGRDVTKFN